MYLIELKDGCVELMGLMMPLQKNVPFFMLGAALKFAAATLFLAASVLCMAVAWFL
jgi:hypothetical protein